MKILKYDNLDLIALSEQLNPKGTYPLIRKKLDALDEAQYFKYINTCHLISEVSRRLNDIDEYFAGNYTKEKLEQKMQQWKDY